LNLFHKSFPKQTHQRKKESLKENNKKEKEIIKRKEQKTNGPTKKIGGGLRIENWWFLENWGGVLKN
jgi:hypothetical protein